VRLEAPYETPIVRFVDGDEAARVPPLAATDSEPRSARLERHRVDGAGKRDAQARRRGGEVPEDHTPVAPGGEQTIAGRGHERERGDRRQRRKDEPELERVALAVAAAATATAAAAAAAGRGDLEAERGREAYGERQRIGTERPGAAEKRPRQRRERRRHATVGSLRRSAQNSSITGSPS
jgi:hypothetical protein